MNLTQSHLEGMHEASGIIIARNLAEIDRKYGPDSDDPQDYHNMPHSVDVVEAVDAIAEKALQEDKITIEERILLPVSASGHDLVYNPFDKRLNEQLSAAATVEAMRPFTCFEERHFDLVSKFIMATVVQQFYPRIIQSVDPKHYATGIIADGDLSSFGMPFNQFWPRAKNYLRELEKTNNQRLMQYLDFEAIILGNHRWYTEEAPLLFPHLQANRDAIRSLQTLYAVQ